MSRSRGASSSMSMGWMYSGPYAVDFRCLGGVVDLWGSVKGDAGVVSAVSRSMRRWEVAAEAIIVVCLLEVLELRQKKMRVARSGHGVGNLGLLNAIFFIIL